MANNQKKLLKEVRANKNFEFLENGKVIFLFKAI